MLKMMGLAKYIPTFREERVTGDISTLLGTVQPEAVQEHRSLYIKTQSNLGAAKRRTEERKSNKLKNSRKGVHRPDVSSVINSGTKDRGETLKALARMWIIPRVDGRPITANHRHRPRDHSTDSNSNQPSTALKNE